MATVKHANLLDSAKRAADALHSDLSVALHDTFDSLRDLRDHVEMLMDAVANSMPTNEEEFGE